MIANNSYHQLQVQLYTSMLVVYVVILSQEELQVSHSAREKELNKQRAVDRVRVRDPANRQRIVSFSIVTTQEIIRMSSK